MKMRERSLLSHCHNHNTAVASRSRRVGVYRISILDRSIDNMVVGVRLIIRSGLKKSREIGNPEVGKSEISIQPWKSRACVRSSVRARQEVSDLHCGSNLSSNVP